MLTEDRKDQGLVLELSVRRTLGSQISNFFSKLGWIKEGKEKILLKLHRKDPNSDFP